MALPLGLNDLCKIDLVACDMAYGAGDRSRVQVGSALASYFDTPGTNGTGVDFLSGKSQPPQHDALLARVACA